MEIQKGQRSPLVQILQNNAQKFQVELSITGVSVDFACFGLNANHNLLNDDYMIFFNQPQTPCDAISLKLEICSAIFLCDLSKLPATVEALSFTAAMEGTETMNQIESGHLKFFVDNQEVACFKFDGSDFNHEKSLMLGEIYRKNSEWRFNAVGQGFQGGFESLVEYFGGVVEVNNQDEITDNQDEDEIDAVPLGKNATIVQNAINAFNDNMTEKFVDEMAVIHIIGAFSAGKSRLVRELLQKHNTVTHLLPISSQERQTALPLEITFGETANLIQIDNQSSDETILSQFPSRAEQMCFDSSAHRLRLEVPEPSLLLGNVTLISAEEGTKRLVLKDMPGWNSGDSFMAENPLANGLVGADNISLVYVVRANGVDSNDDLIRLEAIFEAVDSGDAYFFNGFNLVIVVTRCDDSTEHEAIENRVIERFTKLAEKVGIEDDLTLTVLCVDFGKEHEAFNHEKFADSFWQAVFQPIAAQKQTTTASNWTNRLQHWEVDWLIQPKLARSLKLIDNAKQFIEHFKKEDAFVVNMNKTRLLGLSEKERREKVRDTWKRQIEPFQLSSAAANELCLPENHPLNAWWSDYWLVQIRAMTDVADFLFQQMENAINQLPSEVPDLQKYFQNCVGDIYEQSLEMLRNHFDCVCQVVEPLQHETDNAKVVATLLSLSIIDAKYSDYYDVLKTA